MPPTHHQDRRTPLIAAAAAGQLELAEALLAAGADAAARGPGGVTALHAASAGGNVEVVRLLAARGADRNARNDVRLEAG